MRDVKTISGMMKLARQLISFGGVGTLGFLIDAAVFTCVNLLLQNLYLSRVVSYLAAASSNWFLNRKFTFGASDRSPMQEWGRFIILQTAGGAVNYGVYAFLVTAYSFFASTPVAAIAIGSIAGMGVNFLTAKFFVFRGASDNA